MNHPDLSQFNTRANWFRTGVGLLVVGAALAVLTLVKAAPSFVPNLQPTGWVTRPELSNSLASAAGTYYLPGYVAGDWNGELLAFNIGTDGDIKTTSPWTNQDAAVLLDAKNYNTGRKIVTRDAAGTNIPFRFASLSPSQKADLGGATNGPKILDYVRGDRTNESSAAGWYRVRKSVLGDIVHSTLVHWAHSSTVRRLYVGANDGMLHAFDAATGEEVFAYVPSMLIPNLPKLAANPYVRTHFVDGPIAVDNRKLGTVQRTLLVGGLGAGGKGLYALDVTTPSPASEADAAAQIKWEITPATSGFGNLGYTYSKPVFATLNDGTSAVIVGNGYMNSGNGHAVLYVINADTGSLIKAIDAEPGAATVASPNGLSSPTVVDTNFDGKVDYVYAGDLNGNMWKFDLTSSTTASFSVSKVFTASPVASITTAPAVRPHPKGGYMVLFGTGRTLLAADASDTSVHYVYGIWDGAPAVNTTLLTQTLTETTSGSTRYRYASTSQPDWNASASTGHKGWKLTLPVGGERVVGEAPFVRDNRFYFTSSNPTLSTGTTKGDAWSNQVSYLTGGGFGVTILDVNGDGALNDSDKIDGQVITGKRLGAGVWSQPLDVDLADAGSALYNSNTEQAPSPPPVGPGVSGGHFDVDIYYWEGNDYKNKKHEHEYDDKYDVTGVNMLNASEPKFNISEAITDVDTKFKVLVMNQYLSPAATISLGGNPHESVRTFGGLASQTDAATLLGSLTAYSRSNVTSLEFNLPTDAFHSKDWWGDGGAARAGLIPSDTGCVNKVDKDGVVETEGKYGERFNGALTIQLIKDTTPASALELNYAGGGAKYGWRVKSANFKSYVLVEWTYFWHRNKICYGDGGWVQNPPEDFSTSGESKTPAENSDDPSETNPPNNGGGGGGGGGGGNVRPCDVPGKPACDPHGRPIGTGRYNWREVIRE